MMNVTFEIPGWEMTLSRLRRGSTLSGARLLAWMEQESESDWEDALQMLDGQDILLEIGDIPASSGEGDFGLRLQQERNLVQEGLRYETLEENDPLRLYLQELAAIPVCEDPQLLAQRCLEGTAEREQLMNCLLSLVVDQGRELAGHSVLLLDLMQEGALGLWQAVMEYAGGDVVALCRRAILRAMTKAIVVQARACGVGGKLRQSLENYRSADERLLVSLGRNPTLEEIAQALQITLEEAETLAQMLDNARAVNRAKAASQPTEEAPEDDVAVEHTAHFQMRQRIAELLSGLTELDAQLITLRYGLEGGIPMSPEETAKKLGLTPDAMIAREAAALAMLRKQ